MEQVANERRTSMALPGNWKLYYKATTSTSYASTDMTFKSGGTWSMPSFGYTGQWVEESGEMIFNFDSSKTIYAGNIVDGAAVGILTTFTGVNGFWYLLRQGAAAARQEGPGIDPAGNPSASS
jgi:hypothetical protein